LGRLTIILNNNIVGKNPVIRLDFDFDQTIIYKVKTINGTHWSQSSRFWYIPQNEFNQDIMSISYNYIDSTGIWCLSSRYENEFDEQLFSLNRSTILSKKNVTTDEVINTSQLKPGF
jgi:hypothetical protein